MFSMQDGETFTPQSVQFLPRFTFITDTHTYTLVGICEAVILVEYLFLVSSRLPSSYTNLSLILSQDLQLKCAFVTRCRAHRKASIGLFSFCSFYNVRLLFNAPCSFDRKVIGSEEEKEKLSSHCPTHKPTHT